MKALGTAFNVRERSSSLKCAEYVFGQTERSRTLSQINEA
jgi:hypothetical protein